MVCVVFQLVLRDFDQRLDGTLKDWDYLDWENQPVESLGWPAKYEVLNFEPVESPISL